MADRPDAKFRIVFSVESSEYHGFQTQANLYSFMDSLQGDAGGTWTRLLTSRARPPLCSALRRPPVVTRATKVSARSERAVGWFDGGRMSLLATRAMPRSSSTAMYFSAVSLAVLDLRCHPVLMTLVTLPLPGMPIDG
jgi:hypothetical protein